MVDVGEKAVTAREAEARGSVRMRDATLQMIRQNTARKGDVLAVARIAGIQAAKRTHELIPLCHTVPLTSVDVNFELNESESSVEISAVARTRGRTGVEMEALVAVSGAALTVYDMCKAVDRGIVISSIRVTRKSGGRSGSHEGE